VRAVSRSAAPVYSMRLARKAVPVGTASCVTSSGSAPDQPGPVRAYVYGGAARPAATWGRTLLGLCTVFIHASTTCVSQHRLPSTPGSWITIGSRRRSSQPRANSVSTCGDTMVRDRASFGALLRTSWLIGDVDLVTSASTSEYP
jgi:hypothetical protein